MLRVKAKLSFDVRNQQIRNKCLPCKSARLMPWRVFVFTGLFLNLLVHAHSERTCIMQNPNFSEAGPCSQSRSCFHSDSIVTFDADWHHGLGRKLEVFPRSIPLAGEVFWPDLVSFVEDHCSRQMMYYTPAPSPRSVQVIFHEDQRGWSIAVFQDAGLLTQTSGSSLVTVSQELAEELK